MFFTQSHACPFCVKLHGGKCHRKPLIIKSALLHGMAGISQTLIITCTNVAQALCHMVSPVQGICLKLLFRFAAQGRSGSLPFLEKKSQKSKWTEPQSSDLVIILNWYPVSQVKICHTLNIIRICSCLCTRDLSLTWINFYPMPSKVWDEITYPYQFPNIKVQLLKFWN